MKNSLQIKETAPSEAPMDLLLQADPSLSKVQGYLKGSRCFTASLQGQCVGACIVQEISAGVHELMNISVRADNQKMGVGRRLLRHAIASVRDSNATRMEIGTGTFGYQLAFYQREGFRVDAIDKNFFLLNYQEPIYENGIQLKDMLRLVLHFPLEND